MNAHQTLVAAFAAHQRGEVEAAAARYRAVLKREPDNVDALHLLGVALRELGRPREARDLLARVITKRPNFAEAHHNLGLVLADLGEVPQAREAWLQAAALNPSLGEPWLNLGNSYRVAGDVAGAESAWRNAIARGLGKVARRNLAELFLDNDRFAEAAAEFRAALDETPDDAVLWSRLGIALQSCLDFAGSVAALHRATKLDPTFAEAFNDLGNSVRALGKVAEAAVCFEQALALKPDMVPAMNNLATALSALGRDTEAMIMLRDAINLEHGRPELHLNLANILRRHWHMQEAELEFREALRLRPRYPSALTNLGVLMEQTGRLPEAFALQREALELNPDFPVAWNNLGNCYKAEGRMAEALDAFARCVQLEPQDPIAHSNFLFSLAFIDGFEPLQVRDLHEQWAQHHAGGVVQATHGNVPDPGRRLRIGYVSPDFRQHACSFFLEPLLREHDRTEVEVFAYAEVARPDATTAKLHGMVDHWRSTVGLSDDQMAAQIRNDGIDVLVDLAGHTAQNRLLALARKPAPVQLAWLGYPATTGLPAMDWRLTDAVTEPPGAADSFYTERLFRLPHSLWCYQGPTDMGEVSPLPALSTGRVTFGSFNSFSKIGPRVVALWAQVLLALPDAHLLMVTVPEGEARSALLADFAALGIEPDRLTLHGRLPRPDYAAAFSAVDVALDPFPCNGGTTTCDALWMGLPVVALRGNTFLSRASLSVMTAAGCPEFTAADEDEYVARCVELAADLPRLAAIRAGLRQRMASSPLTDATGFARDMEAAYRKMWQGWCERQAGGG